LINSVVYIAKYSAFTDKIGYNCHFLATEGIAVIQASSFYCFYGVILD
jgi:hypothetical protein